MFYEKFWNNDYYMSEKFPTGQERRKVLEENARSIDNFKNDGKDLINKSRHYTWLDSHLDNSTLGKSFLESFYPLLEGKFEYSLRRYIENSLSKSKGEAIGVEFGGVGVQLFSDFRSGFFKKSFGVTLVDHRKNDTKLKDEKKLPSHTIVKGNIFSSKPYEKLKKLGVDKVDFIIERMGRGLEFVPTEPYKMSEVLNVWYKMLKEDGLMIVQTPPVFNNILKEWGEKIEKDYKDQLIFKYNLGYGIASHVEHSSFRLQKLKGSPEELPLLSPRTLSKLEPYNLGSDNVS